MYQVTINKEIWDKSSFYWDWETCPLTTAIREQLNMEVTGVGFRQVILEDENVYFVNWDNERYEAFEEKMLNDSTHSVVVTLTPEN